MGTHYKGAEAQTNALECYIKLMRASESVTARIHRRLRDWKLTPSQFDVLDALYHLGPLSQLALAQKNLMSPGNITTIVDNLEKRFLVKRRRQTKDRRLVTVYLTERGSKLFADVFPRHVEISAREMGLLSAAEQRELGRLCRKLGLRLSECRCYGE